MRLLRPAWAWSAGLLLSLILLVALLSVVQSPGVAVLRENWMRGLSLLVLVGLASAGLGLAGWAVEHPRSPVHPALGWALATVLVAWLGPGLVQAPLFAPVVRVMVLGGVLAAWAVLARQLGERYRWWPWVTGFTWFFGALLLLRLLVMVRL